jgi:arylsulfatase A-like enzyme
MLRRGDWKYIAYVGYEPQLFNLKDDPDEIRSLARSRPDMAKEMDGVLRKIVDYPAVDAKVKAYDRQSFRQWRDETKANGTYDKLMAQISSGWDDLRDDEIQPWTDKDEALIRKWLDGA